MNNFVIIFALILALIDDISSFNIASFRGIQKMKHLIISRLYEQVNTDTSATIGDIKIDQENKGSGIGQYYQDTLSILAKVPISGLRELIEKYKPSNLPPVTADSEAHISMALDAVWSHHNGNWDELLTALKNEYAQEAENSLLYLEIALAAAKKMSEKRLKELIIKYGTPNSIPKIDKRKYTGKLLKDDYAIELIDLLREQNQNDYEIVSQILEKEYQSSKKSGFGK